MDDKLISAEYRALLAAKHAKKPWGGKGHTWVFQIAPLLNRLLPGDTVLDFGSGTGTFTRDMKPLRPDLEYFEYDPGVPGRDVLAALPTDFVVCTDVMEHVEEDKVDITLKTIDYIARKGVFFNIDLDISTSLLPDGRSTHITVKPIDWWWEKLEANFRLMEWRVHPTKNTQFVVSGWRTWGVE